MSEPSEGRSRLSTSAIVAFSAVSLPTSALSLAISIYLPAYFATNLGVSLTVIGGSWATVRMLDIIVDIVLAETMDRTRTRFGRYRLWLVIGAPVVMLGVYKIFMAPPGFDGVYLVSWLLVMYLGTSILNLSHSAWGAKLAPHYDDRSRLFGVLALVGVLGAFAALTFPAAAKPMGQTHAQSMQDMGWFIFWLTPLAVTLVVWSTPETIAPDQPRRRHSLRDYWTLFTNTSLVRLFLAQAALTLGPGWMGVLYLFFFTDSLGFTANQASILMGGYILAGVIGAPITARMAVRFGKHRTLIFTTTAFSLGLPTVVLIPHGQPMAAVPAMLWCGAMAAGFDLMIRSMLADVGDEVRLEQGRERISLIYAVNTLAAKIAAAFAIGLTFPLLARLGYVAREGVVNTPAAIRSLELVYIIGPIVFVTLGGACVLGWRLDARRHGDIRAQLEARDASFATAPIIDSIESQATVPVTLRGLPGPLREDTNSERPSS
jgi:Na+/melibiose symporter-like transporter